MSLFSRRRRFRSAPRSRFVASTLPVHGCPRLEFALHALRAGCAGEEFVVFTLSPPGCPGSEFVVCTPRRPVARASSRSASTAVSPSYLGDRPPRSGSPESRARAFAIRLPESLRSGCPDHRAPVARSARRPVARSAVARVRRSSFLRDERAASRAPVSRDSRSVLVEQLPARRAGRGAICEAQSCLCDPRIADGARSLSFRRTMRSPRA
jgi:hypothetical protein